MSEQAQRPRRDGGYLVNNQKKQERQPDLRGKVSYNGHGLWLVGWWRDRDNVRHLSLASSDMNANKGETGTAGAQARGKDGRGSLMPHEKTNDRQPDFKGELAHGELSMALAAWWRDKDGDRILVLSAEPPGDGWKNRRGHQSSATVAASPSASDAVQTSTRAGAGTAPASNNQAVDSSGLDELGLGDIFEQQS